MTVCNFALALAAWFATGIILGLALGRMFFVVAQRDEEDRIDDVAAAVHSQVSK
jgi:hypothetical protein